MLWLLAVIAGVLLLVWLFSLFLRRVEQRGGLILTERNCTYRSVGNAMLEVEASLQPQKRHVLEAKRKVKEKKQQFENGDGVD